LGKQIPLTVPSAPGSDILWNQAFLTLLRTAEELRYAAEHVLPHELSLAQYTALHELAEAGDEGISCGELATRLVTRVPDVTRLADRLESLDLIARVRDTKDRRVVKIRLTSKGREFYAQATDPLRVILERRFAGLSTKKRQRLLNLLSRLGGEDL
jgi:DNA-binding MarR family transcriptional regulator